MQVKKKSIVPRRKTPEKLKVSKKLSWSQGRPFEQVLGTLPEDGSCGPGSIGHPGHQEPGAQCTGQTTAVGLLEVYPTLPAYNDRIFLVATDGRNDSSFNHHDNFQP